MSKERRVLRYQGRQLTVLYDVKRCIHAAECVHGLPEVFDPQRKPWVEPDKAEAGPLRETIMRCPTGALHFENTEEGPAEPTPKQNTVVVAPDGPLYVSGDLSIGLTDGTTLSDTRAALCRCGDSHNKPFCDNTHLQKEFTDPGTLGEDKLRVSEVASGLRIDSAPDGPLLVAGPLSIRGAGDQDQSGSKGALCRCGASRNKPYCDGTHVEVGFRAD
jgi:CDGSH-type Zn-finger protein/uncharacterized Fe-S cluster protein YjdI